LKRHLPLALAILMAGAQAALLVATARDKSDTVDEDIYLPAAAILWAHRDFGVNPDSPVLPKWAFALALRAVEPQLDATPRELERAENYLLWYRGRARVERVLFAARLTTIAVTVLAGLLLWRIALRFGPLPGAVTHVLWCFSPAVLAAGSLATLDAWVTGMVIGLTWATARFLEGPRWPRALVVGVFAGLAVACKITALGAVGVAALACAWRARRAAIEAGRSWVRPTLGVALLASAAGMLTLWSLYGFTVGRVAGAAVPFPAWITGALLQVSHGARGHRGYLFGETGLGGWWYFYPVALALKTTLGAQALAAMLVIAWLLRRPRGTDVLLDAALLAYPALLLIVMSTGRTQLGLRYILPAYPFAMLWAGRTFPSLRALGGRWGLMAGALALVAGTAGALRVHPHYLMFFNSWIGGPQRGPQYLVIGDDIGQDQRRLADWQAEQGLSSIYYTWFSGRPEYWGIAYSAPPCRPQSGVYALEAIEVHRPRRIEAGCLDWLTVEPPDERIGYSIYIYRVPRERAERLRNLQSRVPFWKTKTIDAINR
jgi:Dolichyl-phosphate-mannose-protein mannosyltransferase